MATTARGRKGGVGLVLGGGGFVGGAWLVGALQGLATEVGWDPATADCVLGTSAGAMIGSLVVGGLRPEELAAFAHGAVVGPADDAGAAAERLEMMALQVHRRLPLPLPGSPRLALRSLRHPGRYPGLTRMAAWLPRGIMSTDPLKRTVRRLVPRGWVKGRRLWVVAADYETGAATVFGQPASPHADLPDAVAASCAIPGFYHPVEVGEHCYIDGGVRSPSNLDLVAGLGLDVVVCLNPTSSRRSAGGRGWRDRLANLVRENSRRMVERERAIVEAAGTRVILLEPNPADLETMGPNLMRRDNLKEVVAQAAAGIRRRAQSAGLRDLGLSPAA